MDSTNVIDGDCRVMGETLLHSNRDEHSVPPSGKSFLESGRSVDHHTRGGE